MTATLLHEAFGKKAMRLWKIGRVVMEQLRTYPDSDIARELETGELRNCSRPLDREWERWMQTHALFQSGEAIRL